MRSAPSKAEPTTTTAMTSGGQFFASRSRRAWLYGSTLLRGAARNGLSASRSHTQTVCSSSKDTGLRTTRLHTHWHRTVASPRLWDLGDLSMETVTYWNGAAAGATGIA